MCLVTTDEAAKATGLSAWELRIGFKHRGERSAKGSHFPAKQEMP